MGQSPFVACAGEMGQRVIFLDNHLRFSTIAISCV